MDRYYLKNIRAIVFAIIFFWMINPVIPQNVERYKKYHDRGREEVLQGRYEIAILYFDTANQIMPYYPTIYQDKGYAGIQLKRYEDAVEDFNYVLEKKPYMHEVRFQRGIAFYHLDQFDLAKIDLEEVINNSPKKIAEADKYLEYTLMAIAEIDALNQAEINAQQAILEKERLAAARQREAMIWGTVVPLALWTALFIWW